MVTEDFVGRWVQRLRREVPESVAIFLGGSRVRGDAEPYSDADFDIIVPDGPRDEWPSRVDVTEDRLVRISTSIRDVGT